MSGRLAVIAAVLAALVLPASAGAKKIMKVTICGQSACRSTDDHDRLATLPVGGTPTDPPAAAPFYRVRVRMRADRPTSFTMYFLPRQGLLHERAPVGSWLRAEPGRAAALAALARGLTPWPAAKLPYSRPPLPNTARSSRPAASEGTGFPWPVLLAALLGVAGAALALRLHVRARGPATG